MTLRLRSAKSPELASPKRWLASRRRREPDPRTAALRRFALSITGFTILGALALGFEDSWAQPCVALITAYTLELALETIDARAASRPPRYKGALFDYLLPAHITALSIALLLYPGERLWPIVFAVSVAIGSKFVFQVPVHGKRRHFLNPSNFGITVTLLLFPSVGIAPPYHFTENGSALVRWIVPLAVVVAGTMLNVRLTGKGPLIAAWLAGFVGQALIRAAFFGSPLLSPLLPLSGVAVILYTNYMITDPGTTPVRRSSQIAFGLSTAMVYGALVLAQVVFGLFFALTVVCAGRGVGLWALAIRERIPSGLGRVVHEPAPTALAEPVRTEVLSP